jgi:glycosyltransferase involved in cell wall biosynthesis
MRIALLTDTYAPQVNGVTTVVQRIVAVLERSGHDAAVVAPRYPRTPVTPPTRQIRLRSLPFPPYPAIRLSVAAGRRTARFLDEFGPEAVHVATEGPIGLAGRTYALKRGLPLLTSFHTDFPKYTRHYGFAALEPVVWRWLLWFHGPSVATHTPGEAVRDALWHNGIRQAVVWGRGVDTAHFRPARRDPTWRRRNGVPDDTVIVLHVGRLAAEKNLPVLIDAWERAHAAVGRRATFVIAGEGPMEPALAARLPWARRLGFLGRHALADLYASADLCVLPSHTETCGLVALEAMASGIPVVAADAGGFRESVQDGVTGRLVGAADPAGFAAAIVDLVDAPAHRREMGAAGRRFAESRDILHEDTILLEHYRQARHHPRAAARTESCPAA